MQITVPSLLRIKQGTSTKIGKYLSQQQFKNIAIFWGEGVKELLSERISISLATAEINILHEEIWVSSAVEKIFERSLNLSSKTQVILAIGGGKVIDCCKYMAFLNKLPLFVMPTAISNDGFSSPLASLTVNGKKRTLKTGLPQGIVIDTEILANAPPKFFYSGIGDLLSKFTSLNDWKLAFKKNNEYVDDFAVALSQNSLEAFLNYPQKSPQNSECLRILCNSLLLSGIAMEVAGSSRPASGSEHLISHAYDQISSQPSMHGLQVGISTYAISCLQNKEFEKVKKAILETGFFDFAKKYPLNKTEFIEAVKLAPKMKENFITILSEAGQIEKLIEFVEKDELMKQLLTNT